MTRFKKLLGPLVAVFLLAWAGAALSQTNIGGVFVTSRNYLITGSWTWQAATPVTFRGSAAGPFGTKFTVTTPTANRTWNLPDLSGGDLVGTTAAQTFTNKTLTAPVFSGSVTGTYTLAGTPTITAPTITTPTVTSITNTGTLTLPTATGGVPVVLDCGATGSGNQTCSPVTATAATKLYAGNSTLATNAAVITFPTAFAATTSYQCVADDITTRANPVQMISTSGSTATITDTTGASDSINWVCVGY